MKIIIAIAFYFLYWGVCFLGTGTDRKNLISLYSYPEEVQDRVRKDPALTKNVPEAKPMAVVFLGNLLLFTVVFSVLGLALKGTLNLDDYWSAFWYFLAFGEGLGLFDLVAQHKTHPLFVFTGKEILSGSEKPYRSLLARDPAVCRDRRTDSPGRHAALNHT